MLVHWESCHQGSEIPAAEPARADSDIRAKTTITGEVAGRGLDAAAFPSPSHFVMDLARRLDLMGVILSIIWGALSSATKSSIT